MSQAQKKMGEPQTVAGRIEALMIEKGWAATRLSVRAGLGKGAVNDILSDPDRHPRPATLAKLARALGVDQEYLACESDVRRAGSRLHDGPAWADLPNGADAMPLLEKLDLEIAGAGGDLTSYHLPPGAEGLGVPADSTVVLSRSAVPKTGDLVVVNDPSLGRCVRYLAEPYLIGLDDEGRVRHWLRSDSTQLLGKVVLVVRLP